MNYLDFEKPLAEIEGKAEELRAMARGNKDMDIEAEAKALDKKAADMLADCQIDAETRGKEKPSDHVPIWIDLAL